VVPSRFQRLVVDLSGVRPLSPTFSGSTVTQSERNDLLFAPGNLLLGLRRACITAGAPFKLICRLVHASLGNHADEATATSAISVQPESGVIRDCEDSLGGFS
jgi:hypothetical protein